MLYISIVVGSFSKVWGINYTPTLAHWKMMLNRGNEAIMDTTFLSIMATPIAGLLGMMIAFLVVRKMFSGKDVLDFGSNLGAGVPGTILGIGFVLSFVVSPWLLVWTLYIVMALLLTRTLFKTRRQQWGVLLIGSLPALLLFLLPTLWDIELSEEILMYLLGALYLVLAAYYFLGRQRKALRQDLGWYGFLPDYGQSHLVHCPTHRRPEPPDRQFILERRGFPTIRLHPGFLPDSADNIDDSLHIRRDHTC